MDICVFTLFPEMFTGPLDNSILKKAREKGLISIKIIDYRYYSPSRHKNVDDSPFGGGAGMVLKPEPIYYALEKNCPRPGKVLLMTPQGKTFDQALAKLLASEESLAIICGHYEGYDERIRALSDYELSIGDYVLTGGELPAMVVIDAVCRLLPGVLGEKESPLTDSFYDGLLEHPQYTRPRDFRGMRVPDVLLSGNHEQIRVWRRKESLRRTLLRRPDLLAKASLSEEDRELLEEIAREERQKDE
ncbi:MAG: tRNA (guanosine(37)-N1)-methyltransferase TrmD [Peptococcaceae bacterium]|jgi:tRNA (guanine37-N1)-methyltransferase|nr:tRNA (guanosine(37)-N1)-methyltransferase TrmD [Peptococcaceae bacterium]MDH7525681.1 tRNA (guanosine(37)-N1)-methyltransferase TrmD [Peptococcaceae bacterium]